MAKYSSFTAKYCLSLSAPYSRKLKSISELADCTSAQNPQNKWDAYYNKFMRIIYIMKH